jgi:hypothetical protein
LKIFSVILTISDFIFRLFRIGLCQFGFRPEPCPTAIWNPVELTNVEKHLTGKGFHHIRLPSFPCCHTCARLVLFVADGLAIYSCMQVAIYSAKISVRLVVWDPAGAHDHEEWVHRGFVQALYSFFG